MSWLWPSALPLLGLVPLIIAVYIWVLRRRRVGVRYSSLSLVRAALPRYSWLRRHLPFALFILALTSLIVAVARPVHLVTIPTSQATIILTIDVSGSMRQNDILPSRLEAAKAAALSFVRSEPPSTQIGVVAFAGYAELIQPPTSDQNALKAAIVALTTGRGTAIGTAILESLDAIAASDPSVAPRLRNGARQSGPTPTPVPKGAYAPDIIVLLTDGVSTIGPLPLDAAQQAVDRGVRIYTIGFGTDQGETNFDTGPFGGRNFRRGIDEATLKQIAERTGAAYYAAASGDELLKVFRGLPTYLIAKHEVMEISVAFAALGAFLAAVAMGLGLLWHPVL